jgi:hypothetical protein
LLAERILIMTRELQVRRKKLVLALTQVDRAIAATEKRLAQIKTRLAVLARAEPKAA